MFYHVKELQFNARVEKPDPRFAAMLLEQFGGANGELAAAMQYSIQGLNCDDLERKDLLMDIGTEELSHLEVIGSLVCMLNKGAKGRLAEAVEEEGELFRSLQGAGNDSHLTQVLYGGGPALIEAVTYRHSGHSRADPAKYRPEGELERWLQRDPINLYRARLLEIGVADGTLKDIEGETMRKVDEATAIAKASPAPALEGIERNVWADGGAAWRN